MASRTAHDNSILRLLLMPVLALGLAVGCAPASSGGSPSGGQSGGGNTGNPQAGNTGNPQAGSTGNPQAGNTGNPQAGNTGNPQAGNTGNPQAGNTGNPQAGSTGNPQGGTTSNPQAGSTGNPQGGTTSNPQGGTTSNPQGGTTSNPQGGTTSNPQGGTTTSSGGTTKASGGTTSPGGTTGSPGGSTGTTGNPPGWWQTSDWKVTSANWHGCVWTGIDVVAATTTKITPQDFTAASSEGGPYEVSGKVNLSYDAVALLGFNLNETSGTKPNQCKYDPTTATAAGPPNASMATITKTYAGLAVNWSAKTKPGLFRIQLQAPDSATNLADSWCVTVTDAQGPSFIKWTDFHSYCWDYPTSVDTHTAVQYAGQDIDAISFLVPGNGTADTPFDFTVTGFAPGNSTADAPGKAAACGQMTGTVGSTTQLSGQPAIDASAQRAAVTGTDCKKYIINNNNWGNETGTYQSLSYTGNTFTDTVTSGSGGGANVVSFPSIYIGANGQTASGAYNTWTDSGLPKQISAMTSVQTSFTWSGGKSGGNYNAAYDVWFAKTQPTAGGYDDGPSGFIMVWLYKPSGSQPIGNAGTTRTATIAGHTWTVWRGPRIGNARGTDGNGRPVISYVANDSPVKSFSFDLKLFMNDAVANAGDDMSKGGGITQPFSNDWWLTDVFAGFEIWSGGDAQGLQDTFTCAVK